MSAAAALLEQPPPSGPRLVVPPSPSVAEARAAITRLVLEVASARRRVVGTEQELPVPALDRLHRLLTGSACHDVEQLRRLDQLIAAAIDLGARAAREVMAAVHVLVGRGRAVRAVTGCYQPTERS